MPQAQQIRKVEPLLVDRFLFVRVLTEGGLTGIGECGAWGQLEASAAAIQSFAGYLVGRDAGAIEDHWNVLQRFGHFRGAAIMGALSAIDIALWDIKGQALGVPIHALLGGPTRQRARLYGHVKAATVAEMVERCLELRARGFTAIGHLNPFLDEPREEPDFKAHARRMADAVACVQEVRAAVGLDVDLCLEIHRRLSPADAVVFGRAVEPLQPMFIEDPIAPGNPEAMAEVAAKLAVPVATGERFSSPGEFRTLLAQNGARYARVSVCLCGGITGGRKIAALAEAHGVEVVPHNPLSPVSLLACLQLAAAIPNFAIQEYPTSGDGWHMRSGSDLRGHEFVRGLQPPDEEGFMAIPVTPGLGVTLDDEVLAARPALPRSIAMRRHRDGSPVDQ